MRRYRQKKIYQGTCLVGSKCGKTHLRASVKSKTFSGGIASGPPRKRMKREGRGRTDREEEERWRGGEGWDGEGRAGEEREGESREMEGTGIRGKYAS
jgi:hypothetical protein